MSAIRAGGPVAVIVGGGTLPFTGLNLLWVFAGSLLLMLLGLGLTGLLGRRRQAGKP